MAFGVFQDSRAWCLPGLMGRLSDWNAVQHSFLICRGIPRGTVSAHLGFRAVGVWEVCRKGRRDDLSWKLDVGPEDRVRTGEAFRGCWV